MNLPGKRRYDVAVVGGGPAGATTAYLLARNGLSVVLFEKRHFPRIKTCAGLLTWKTIDIIRRLFGNSLTDLKTQELVTHECRNYRIYCGKSEIVRGRLDYPFHFIDRATYDHFCLNAALLAGAEVYTGTGISLIDPDRGCLWSERGHAFYASAIIGADGAWSKVRRHLQNAKDARHRFASGMAHTFEVNLPHRNRDADIESWASLHFGLVPWGYAWSFPKKQYHTIGICSLSRGKKAALKDSFHEFLNHLAPHRTSQAVWQSHPLPYGNFLSEPGRGRVLLVGDACGLADPLLGEGIYYAHRSAELAAQAILKAGLERGRASRMYRRLLDKEILHELRWIKLLRTALFWGGRRRRYRGLRMMFKLIPKRLEAAVQGQLPFGRLFFP